MLFKTLYRPAVSDDEFVDAVVDNAATRANGQIEELDAKVSELTRLTGEIFCCLTDEQKEGIAQVFGWKVVEA